MAFAGPGVAPEGLEEVLRRLREETRRRFPGVRVALEPSGFVPTGIGALDRHLGGLPRGALTFLDVPVGLGRATLVRALAAGVAATGEPVAVIDGERNLDPAAFLGEEMAPVALVRPKDRGEALWTVEVLLRSGGFRLVVLDGVAPRDPSLTVRLERLAAGAGTALVMALARTGETGWAGPVALTLRAGRGEIRWEPGLGGPSRPAGRGIPLEVVQKNWSGPTVSLSLWARAQGSPDPPSLPPLPPVPVSPHPGGKAGGRSHGSKA